MDQDIPIIDFRPFLDRSSDDARVQTARDLVEACRTVGFVYIRNHGLPQADLDRAFAMSQKFFDLPIEDKMKAPHPPGWAVHRGYSEPGLEKVSNAFSASDNVELAKQLREVQDYKESYEVGSEENYQQPNVWPPDDVLPEWRLFMTSFYWACAEIAQDILRALALGMGYEDEGTLLQHVDGHHNQLRLLHYPPIPADMLDNSKFARMPAHSDWSIITFLFQDNCGGLQVENPAEDGTFIDVAPVADTLVLNVGDLLMRWSNDYLKSTQHRVILPPVGNRSSTQGPLTQARYSIPYFVTCGPDVLISCLDVDGCTALKYEPITQGEYAAMRARMQY